MDKKEQVVKLEFINTDFTFAENGKFNLTKTGMEKIDQIYNQPDPELREKIARIIYGSDFTGLEARWDNCDNQDFRLERADQILSLLANPKEPVVFEPIKLTAECPYIRIEGKSVVCPKAIKQEPVTESCPIPKPPLTGSELIAKERERQMSQEGWTAEHDDQHTDNELARVGAIYALPAKFRFYAQAWPLTWSREWYKPTPTNRIKELTKAGALIAAEIDRLQRHRKE